MLPFSNARAFVRTAAHTTKAWADHLGDGQGQRKGKTNLLRMPEMGDGGGDYAAWSKRCSTADSHSLLAECRPHSSVEQTINAGLL